MKTTVVHLKKSKYDVYIGRPSPFGNPFVIGKDGSREEVIEKYRAHFLKLVADPEFRKKLESLRDKVLGCYCHPKACHGHVIAEYLEKTE